MSESIVLTPNKSRTTKIVIGLGFGDEGKGLTTSYLCSITENPLVIRFNGGHQAGHTVVHNGNRHVFSNFGAGTLQGVPSFWNKDCTIFPRSIVNEHNTLGEFGDCPAPILYVHPLCPVTTPYDFHANQLEEDARGTNRHGSVGTGFGKTIQRQEDFYTLYAQDLFYPSIVKAKLSNIAKYYGDIRLPSKETIANFMLDIEDCLKIIRIDKSFRDLAMEGFNFICEGAQGVLLDQDFGFFPNVTRSNTTSKNAMELLGLLKPEIYYVTRAYGTRHGVGFMSKESSAESLGLKNTENETNVSHKYQGDFRVGEIDTEMINYAIQSDSHFSRGGQKNLVITCLDQYDLDIEAFLDDIKCTFENVYTSHGPSLTDVSEYTQTAVVL